MNYSKLSRSQKEKLLQKIRDGKINPLALRGPVTYVAIQDNAGNYEIDGKLLNQQQYAEFVKKIEERNNNAVLLNLGGEFQSTIINLIPCIGCDPLPAA